LKTQQTFLSLLLAALLTLTSAFAIAADEDASMAPNVDLSTVTPSGTIEMSSTSISLLFGGSWGSGTLHYQGKSYPFKVKGLNAGGIGVNTADATGDVYFLNSIDDFGGIFSYRKAGATAYKGSTRSTFDNNKGVVFTLKEKTTGAALSIGLGGVEIQMEK
jgi:hypothetical protein